MMDVKNRDFGGKKISRGNRSARREPGPVDPNPTSTDLLRYLIFNSVKC
jgi:hypothetical protein